MIHSRECNESTKILLISHKTHQYTRVTTLVLTLDTEGMTDSNLRGSFSSARPGHISGDGTCRGNAPHIISRPAPASRAEQRDRVGAAQNIGPLLNVMNIPVFSCSCPHQSSIIVMLLLPLLPESICIMLMTNINCFLIIMNQKYGKDLAGGETDREMGKNHIRADQKQTVTQTY